MSEVRLLKIKTSLAEQMARPGGRTIAEAERRANEGLERHKEKAMAAISERIHQLEQLVAARVRGTENLVYGVASEMIGTGGFFDTGPLYDAGYSLCEVVDLMGQSGRWHWPSVAVHVRALRLIMAGGCKSDETTAALLEGLRAVVARARSQQG